MSKSREVPMGSISSGTMRKEDLIPTFMSFLEVTTKDKEDRQLIRKIKKTLRNDWEGYYESERSDWDLEDLFEALHRCSAPYFYFGAHPGDGSDYGWWLSEDFENDFDGLKVEDLSEVPRDYAGEILVINDHGNMTLYAKSRTQKPREIWAVV